MENAGITIFWFRRDIRLDDNAGLYHALKESGNVLPIFIFDEEILGKLEDKADRRVDFIHQALQHLNNQLIALGSALHVYYGRPREVFENLILQSRITAVYTNHDYEPYARERDAHIHQVLQKKGIAFKTYKDQCIFEKDEVLKSDGKPYTVFTPYSRKWKSLLTPFYYRSYPCKNYYHRFYKTGLIVFPPLQSIGFKKTAVNLQRVALPDIQLLAEYKEKRNYPALKGTSMISMHLRFGLVSIRQLVRLTLPLSGAWLNELIWREFYMMILWHFPHVATQPFKKEYEAIQWRNNEQEFAKWCSGNTGFPIVDAGMRELNQTGYMHNRVRMIVSSFLVKDLLIDYRWGEAYFAARLNDFDLSANNGGWQWAAGTGCDAAPYFRIFNPLMQQKKFDPEFKYIRRWLPEYGSPSYPQPMVDHASARQRTLETYKKGLAGYRQMNLF